MSTQPSLVYKTATINPIQDPGIRPIKISDSRQGLEKYECENDADPFFAKIRQELIHTLSSKFNAHLPKKPSPTTLRRPMVTVTEARATPPTSAFTIQLLPPDVHKEAFQRELSLSLTIAVKEFLNFKKLDPPQRQAIKPVDLSEKLGVTVYDYVIKNIDSTTKGSLKIKIYQYVIDEQIIEKSILLSSSLAVCDPPEPSVNQSVHADTVILSKRSQHGPSPSSSPPHSPSIPSIAAKIALDVAQNGSASALASPPFSPHSSRLQLNHPQPVHFNFKPSSSQSGNKTLTQSPEDAPSKSGWKCLCC